MDMGKGAPALRPAAGAARLKSEGEHMVNYLIKRTLFALLLVLVVVTIVFGIVRLAPGDPAIVILGDAASQESIEALHEEMGLNQPLWRQYAVFMGNLAQLDLGDSMINGVPVLDQLEVALPYTLELTTAGIILGVGRAVGETMAVIMVAGNQARIPGGILEGVRTLTANIVMEMGYATDLHREALIATAVVLFVFILLVNALFAALRRRRKI